LKEKKVVVIPKLYSQQAHSQLQNNVREMDKVYGGSHELLTNIYHTENLSQQKNFRGQY